MGLDLTLAPMQHDSLKWWLAHTRIDLDRDYRIFGQIANVHRGDAVIVCDPKPLPADRKFQWYSDDGVKDTIEDPYGDKLTYVLAGELVKVKVPNDAGAWNKAVFSFIRAIPPETPVVLWWH